MSEKYKCPHCENEIENLDVFITETKKFLLDVRTKDMDIVEDDLTGNGYVYVCCPICGEEITRGREVILHGDPIGEALEKVRI